jgi:VanZ family protein
MRRFLQYWLPVLAWMSLIFLLYTDVGSATSTSRFIEPILRWLIPNISPGAVEKAHFFIRKAGHFSEYGVLGLLLWRALRQTRLGASDRTPWKTAVAALVLMAAYAATDEFHQSFVPTRTPSVRDVMIDTSGSFLSLCIICTWTTRRRKSSL